MAKRRKVARDYASVLAFIEALPPPKDGFVRVFRGQARHYNKILPTAFRAPLKGRPQWYASVRLVAKRLAGDRSAPEYDSERVASIVETEAAVQHYGTGSPYLDVTHDPAIALWFALHVPDRSGFELHFARAGGEPLTYVAPVTSFSRHDRSGVLYVFDAQEWRGRPRAHGRLFDMSEVSGEGLPSERARRQSGCLLYAEGDGDLTTCLAAEPLPVGWPMENAPDALFADAEFIFPPPHEDAMLDALLQFPLVPDLSTSSDGRGLLRHPLNVQIYEPSDWSEYEARIGSLSMPLILPTLRSVVDEESESRILSALPILLEAPMIAIREHESWNDEVLLQSLAEKSQPRRSKAFRSRAKLDLRNVFVEFSPLEVQRWPDPEDEFLVPRGLWVLREGPGILVNAFAELYRGRKLLEPLQFGPYAVSLGKDGALALDPLRGDPDKRLRVWVARALRPVLTLLRDLNPEEKQYAYKTGIVGGGQMIRYTPELGRIADLVPATEEYLGVRYFIARDRGSGEPYTGHL